MWNRRLIPREKRIDKSLEHCCNAMKEAVDIKYSPVIYLARMREYVILDRSGNGADHMTFCYNCGTELPKDLRSEWHDIIRNEYGIEDPFDFKDYKDKVPKEFLTEEWWRRRGL